MVGFMRIVTLMESLKPGNAGHSLQATRKAQSHEALYLAPSRECPVGPALDCEAWTDPKASLVKINYTVAQPIQPAGCALQPANSDNDGWRDVHLPLSLQNENTRDSVGACVP